MAEIFSGGLQQLHGRGVCMLYMFVGWILGKMFMSHEESCVWLGGGGGGGGIALSQWSFLFESSVRMPVNKISYKLNDQTFI